MLQKSLKGAIGIAIGTAIGGCLLPRLLFAERYNHTFPPIWQQGILYLIVGYISSFLVLLLINWLNKSD